MCKTMQVIVDREREAAEVAKGKRSHYGKCRGMLSVW